MSEAGTVTTRAKERVRGEKVEPVGLYSLYKQEIKSSMENEVNRGKEGHFFRERKSLKTIAVGNERETSSWDKPKGLVVCVQGLARLIPGGLVV